MTLSPWEELATMPSVFAPNVGEANARSHSLPKNSPTQTITRRQSAFESLTRGLRKKSEIEIILEGNDDFVRSYSTFDQIKGQVKIRFEHDTIIDGLQVLFEGQSDTYVEKLASASPTTGRTTGRHVFLRMQQPTPDNLLPEDNLARAGVTYTVPFTFVVPDRLLPYICNHKAEHPEIHDRHLQLPPSMGDPLLSGEGQVLMDDLAPEMSKITYAVKARVGRTSPTSGRPMDIVEKSARVRVVPAREEEPPTAVDEHSKSYQLRREKNVRKGLFKIGKKLGRLTAEASQPKSLRLPSPRNRSKEPVSTMATVTLRFDPASRDENPPQLGNLTSKLRVFTFFGAACFKNLPEPGTLDHWSSLHGMFPETVDLSCRNIETVSWTKHAPNPDSRKPSGSASLGAGTTTRRQSAWTTDSEKSDLTRRASNVSDESSSTSSSGSAVSSTETPSPSSAHDPSLPYYTAKILVPVALPHTSDSSSSSESPSATAGGRSNSVSAPTGSKSSGPLNRNVKKVTFIPSFHSCIISRTYTLELGLTFHPVNAAGNTSNTLGAPSLTLKTPVQISQDGSAAPPIDFAESAIGYNSNFGVDDGFAHGTGTGDSDAMFGDSTEHDEAIARQLERQLNFSNPFTGGTFASTHPSSQTRSGGGNATGFRGEAIPEYEEVQTTLPGGASANVTRHASLSPAPTAATGRGQQRQQDLPPEYQSNPFRGFGNGGRRHSNVETRIPLRHTYYPIAFLGTL